MHAVIDFLQGYGWFIGTPLAFLIVVAYIFRPGANRAYKKDAELPFQDDEPKVGQDGDPKSQGPTP